LERNEIPFVLGTAGHIDHGKTALVKALTGVDCDRLLEEKRRGITIELGFAPLTLPDGRTLSVVDVPGHERFIRQMTAGAAGVDAVMLVVAADEGVMPQTREHLEILTLLGVRDGLVALTKTDLVEPDLRDLAAEDVAELVRGTFLEGRPILPVSAVSGEGREALLAALAALVDRVPPRDQGGAFFLPIDRAFAVAGFGTVVTGTAYRGVLREGDEIEVLPSERSARVRSIQVHGRTEKEARAGQRTAINLAGLSLEDLSRGDVVCARGSYASTRCLDVSLSLLASAPEPIRHWQRIRLHLGTSDTIARISLLEAPRLFPGTTAPAQLLPEEPLAAAFGQRFIVRFYSPLRTIGGGRVLDPYASKPRGRSARAETLAHLRRLEEDLAPRPRARAIIARRGPIGERELILRAQLDQEALPELLDPLIRRGLLVRLPGSDPVLLSREKEELLRALLRETLRAYHEKNPHLAGLPLEDGASLFPGLDPRAGRELLRRAAEADGAPFVLEEGRIRLADFRPRDDRAFNRRVEEALAFANGRGFLIPSLEELAAALRLERRDLQPLVTALRERGLARIVGENLLLTAETGREFHRLLAEMKGEITVATLRDASGASRKYTLPILEHFDAAGITRRVGDKRVLLRRPEA